MDRTRLRSKPLAILVVFVVIYGIKRKKSKSEGRLPGIPDAAAVDADAVATTALESQLPESSVLWVPYKQGLRRVKVVHTLQHQFDRDSVYFARGGHFAEEAKALLHVLFPTLNCRATHYLAIHMLLLAVRTYLSLVVAELDGRIVRHLMSANMRGFTQGLVEWLALAVPASYVNALIKYFEGKISLTFRKTLIRYIHDLYLGSDQEYYKLASLDGELQDIDHYIASDVTRFCTAAAKLYSSVGKPFLDLAVFSVQLSRNLGGRAFPGIFLNYFITAALLKSVSPAFGKLAARETLLEGDYRNAHSRVITNAEEIAFYDGSVIESRSLKQGFKRLQQHIYTQIKTKAWYSVVENYVLKYSWSASGFLFSSIPVFLPDLVSRGTASSHGGSARRNGEEQNMGQFVTNKRILVSISDAGGRIMYSIKDLAELSSYTRRVYQLIAALYRVRNQNYISTSEKGEYTMADIQGRLENSGTTISFDGVPVVVPGHGHDLSNGEVLLKPLTFEVDPQQHLLIVGSNGTGKSSIARIMAGMWPIYRGLLKRCPSVSFLPQKPYFSIGTLRDQVIYPQTHFDMISQHRTDEEIMHILQRVNLAHLPEREGGLDAHKEWKDVLSGGERQRLMFARILYTRPKFAVIDEGTSAVSTDTEGQLYEECKSDGITLLTITHRISLLKYHSAKLEVGLGTDGTEWSLEGSTKHGWQSLDTEISHLENFLSEVPKLRQRREEVIKALAAC